MSEGMTASETESMQEAVVAMTDSEVVSRLEAMAKRELELLKSPAFASGPLREETIVNAAALAAAAERLAPPLPEPEERG